MGLRRSNYKNKHQKGANLVEYSLVVALISMIVAGSVKFLGFSITEKYIASAVTVWGCIPHQIVAELCIKGASCGEFLVDVSCADEVQEEEST